MSKSTFVISIASLCLFVAGCSKTKSDAVAGSAAKPAAKAQQRDTFKAADQFDPADVAAIRKMRNEWVSAFANGDADPVDFMFTDDALFNLPSELSSTGETALTAKWIFKRFSAQLIFDEKSEQFVTDGGDPRKTSKLPWVSYYVPYKLTLKPRQGGHPVESDGRFMTRFRRQPDGSLRVMRGFSVGQKTLDFTLNRVRNDGTVHLSSLRGKPTVLIFGSYT